MNLLILVLFFAEEVPVQIPMMKSPLDKIQLTPGQALPPGFPGPFIFADSLSSVETLLTNIQVNNISINKINVIQDISTYINYFTFEKLKQIRWTVCHFLYFDRVYWKWLWIMLAFKRSRFNKKKGNCKWSSIEREKLEKTLKDNWQLSFKAEVSLTSSV